MSDNKWLMDDPTDGADAKATTDFVAEIVGKQIKDELRAPVEDEAGKQRLKAMTDLQTMDRIQAMQDKADRAMIYHVAVVSTEGNYMYAPGEPDSIGDWLAAALDETKSLSEYSDLKFIAEELVPYMVKHQIGNAAVLWASGFKKKARTAVPYLRFLFRKAPPNLKDEVVKVIAWITDPKITKKDIEDALKDARGVTPPIPADAYETILPGKKTRLVIECDDDQLTVIKKRLKNLINIIGAESHEIKKGADL